ncbi:MAG: hypothetical protein K2Q01_03395, partial [Rickettsiales bacterium]|nr:hypothetical protein [Rickettsiales bacterium]
NPAMKEMLSATDITEVGKAQQIMRDLDAVYKAYGEVNHVPLTEGGPSISDYFEEARRRMNPNGALSFEGQDYALRENAARLAKVVKHADRANYSVSEPAANASGRPNAPIDTATALAALDPVTAERMATQQAYAALGVAGPADSAAHAASILLKTMGIDGNDTYLALLKTGKLEIDLNPAGPDFAKNKVKAAQVLKAHRDLANARRAAGGDVSELPAVKLEGGKLVLSLMDGTDPAHSEALRSQQIALLLQEAPDFKSSATAQSTLQGVVFAQLQYQDTVAFFDRLSAMLEKNEKIDPRVTLPDMPATRSQRAFQQAALDMQATREELAKATDAAKQEQLKAKLEQQQKQMLAIREEAANKHVARAESLHNRALVEHAQSTRASGVMNVAGALQAFQSLEHIEQNPALSEQEKAVQRSLAYANMASGGAGALIDLRNLRRPGAIGGVKLGVATGVLGMASSGMSLRDALSAAINNRDPQARSDRAADVIISGGHFTSSSLGAVGGVATLAGYSALGTAAMYASSAIAIPLSVIDWRMQGMAYGNLITEMQEHHRGMQAAIYQTNSTPAASPEYADVPGLKPQTVEYSKLSRFLSAVKMPPGNAQVAAELQKILDENPEAFQARVAQLSQEWSREALRIAQEVSPENQAGRLNQPGTNAQTRMLNQVNDLNRLATLGRASIAEVSGELSDGKRNYLDRFKDFKRIDPTLDYATREQMKNLRALRLALSNNGRLSGIVERLGLAGDSPQAKELNASVQAPAQLLETRKARALELASTTPPDTKKIQAYLGVSDEEWNRKDEQGNSLNTYISYLIQQDNEQKRTQLDALDGNGDGTLRGGVQAELRQRREQLDSLLGGMSMEQKKKSISQQPNQALAEYLFSEGMERGAELDNYQTATLKGVAKLNFTRTVQTVEPLLQEDKKNRERIAATARAAEALKVKRAALRSATPQEREAASKALVEAKQALLTQFLEMHHTVFAYHNTPPFANERNTPQALGKLIDENRARFLKAMEQDDAADPSKPSQVALLLNGDLRSQYETMSRSAAFFQSQKATAERLGIQDKPEAFGLGLVQNLEQYQALKHELLPETVAAQAREEAKAFSTQLAKLTEQNAALQPAVQAAQETLRMLGKPVTDRPIRDEKGEPMKDKDGKPVTEASLKRDMLAAIEAEQKALAVLRKQAAEAPGEGVNSRITLKEHRILLLQLNIEELQRNATRSLLVEAAQAKAKYREETFAIIEKIAQLRVQESALPLSDRNAIAMLGTKALYAQKRFIALQAQKPPATALELEKAEMDVLLLQRQAAKRTYAAAVPAMQQGALPPEARETAAAPAEEADLLSASVLSADPNVVLSAMQSLANTGSPMGIALRSALEMRLGDLTKQAATGAPEALQSLTPESLRQALASAEKQDADKAPSATDATLGALKPAGPMAKSGNGAELS